MKTIEGYNVKIFTDNVEESAIEQIKRLMSIDVFSGCKVRIMPDVHAGAGCVIGFTGNLGEKVIPNIVGVDIGCGILVQPFQCLKKIDFPFYEIIKNDANGYECGRERCDDIVTAYIRFSTLMNVFPEYTIKMNFVTEKEIHTVMQLPVR